MVVGTWSPTGRDTYRYDVNIPYDEETIVTVTATEDFTEWTKEHDKSRINIDKKKMKGLGLGKRSELDQILLSLKGSRHTRLDKYIRRRRMLRDTCLRASSVKF